MELGTGIFLSAIFLGTVALFIATKDRWNWKKILLWPFGTLVVIAIIGASIAYLYQWHEDRPRKLTELWGVAINDTYGDVKFKKGEPTQSVDGDIWVYKAYQTLDGNYVVYFKNDRVRSIIYFGPMYNGPLIPGVGHYDTLQELEARLGPPSYVSRSKDELSRAYSYEKFNIVIHFEEGKMSALGIYEPSMGPFRFKEESEEL